MEEVVTGWRKLPARLRWVIAGIGEASRRWVALPVGYLSLLSVGLWIVVATFDIPRTAPFVQAIWPTVGAVMLTSGCDLALCHADRCLSSFRSPLRAVSAGAAIALMIVSIFIARDHASCLWFSAYGGQVLVMLWKTRRR